MESPKITEEEIIPAETLYDKAIDNVENDRFKSALESFEKLERQHPYSEYTERSRMMTTFIYFRLGDYDRTILAADRFLALYPSSSEAPYAMYLKGASQYNQIKDLTPRSADRAGCDCDIPVDHQQLPPTHAMPKTRKSGF